MDTPTTTPATTPDGIPILYLRRLDAFCVDCQRTVCLLSDAPEGSGETRCPLCLAAGLLFGWLTPR